MDGSLIFDTKVNTKEAQKSLTALGQAGATALGVFAGDLLKRGVDGLINLSTAGVNAYAQFEQLQGGIETMFKGSMDEVMKNADKAYKNLGMSANKYMDMTMSFSASLLQSLGGDTAKAAKYADMAITDMADNANKMGTDIASIQNAYQGFAKQNYTMLDNLKLGYGGTKTEMERLLKDAEAITGVRYDISNLNDVYSAIHVIQGGVDELNGGLGDVSKGLGITGTSAKEASTTIEGSMKTAKASWENLLEAIANPEKNAGEATKNFVKATLQVWQNVKPVIKKIASEIPNVIQGVLDGASIEFPALKIFANGFRALRENMNLVKPVVVALTTALITFKATLAITSVISQVIGFLKQFKDINELAAAAQAFLNATMLANPFALVVAAIASVIAVLYYLWQTNDEFRAAVISAWEAICTFFATLPENISRSLSAIIENVRTWVNDMTASAVQAGTEFLNNVTTFISELPGRVWTFLTETIDKLRVWVNDMGSKGTEAIRNLIDKVVDGAKAIPGKMMEIGKNIVDGVWKGISNKFTEFKNNVTGFFTGIVGGVKEALGIHSPSRVFKYIGEMCVAGFDEGTDGFNLDNFTDMASASFNTVSANVAGGMMANTGNTFNFYDVQTDPDSIMRKADNTLQFGLAGGI